MTALAEDILDFSLELFDAHPATLLGLSSEFISAPRMDDRLCSFAAIQALINSCETDEAAQLPSRGSRADIKGTTTTETKETGRHAKLVALFDTEEVGSVLRVGAKSNFLRSVVERVVEAFVSKAQQQQSPVYTTIPSNTIVSPLLPLYYPINHLTDATLLSYLPQSTIAQTLARSFLISADVSHSYNPNFEGIYLEGGSPTLNKGPAVYMDANGHMTSEPVGVTMMRILTERVGPDGGEVQSTFFSHRITHNVQTDFDLLLVLYPRNDSRTGGTIGPTLSQDLGVRAIDMGIPMMSMHSIRAITGSKDPGIAVKLWEGFFDYYPEINRVVQDLA
jgi:aminopeptidase I